MTVPHALRNVLIIVPFCAAPDAAVIGGIDVVMPDWLEQMAAMGHTRAPTPKLFTDNLS